jgi:hypothetical protein
VGLLRQPGVRRNNAAHSAARACAHIPKWPQCGGIFRSKRHSSGRDARMGRSVTATWRGDLAVDLLQIQP